MTQYRVTVAAVKVGTRYGGSIRSSTHAPPPASPISDGHNNGKCCFVGLEPSTLLNTLQAWHHNSLYISLAKQLLFVINSTSLMTKPRLEFVGCQWWWGSGLKLRSLVPMSYFKPHERDLHRCFTDPYYKCFDLALCLEISSPLIFFWEFWQFFQDSVQGSLGEACTPLALLPSSLVMFAETLRTSVHLHCINSSHVLVMTSLLVFPRVDSDLESRQHILLVFVSLAQSPAYNNKSNSNT